MLSFSFPFWEMLNITFAHEHSSLQLNPMIAFEKVYMEIHSVNVCVCFCVVIRCQWAKFRRECLEGKGCENRYNQQTAGKHLWGFVRITAVNVNIMTICRCNSYFDWFALKFLHTEAYVIFFLRDFFLNKSHKSIQYFTFLSVFFCIWNYRNVFFSVCC